MRPFRNFAPVLRAFLVLGFVALSLVTGCGKVRSWFHREPPNPHAVTIGWAASPTPVAGYNVYRASPPGGPAKLTLRMVTGLQYTDNTVEAGRTYSYYVTAVDFKGNESNPSKVITVTVPLTATPPGKQ
jgi:hypothetical protein